MYAARGIRMALVARRVHTTSAIFPVIRPTTRTISPQIRRRSTMAPGPQLTKARGGALLTLNVAIDTLDLAKSLSVIAPAQAAFGSVSALLIMIRVRASVS